MLKLFLVAFHQSCRFPKGKSGAFFPCPIIFPAWLGSLMGLFLPQWKLELCSCCELPLEKLFFPAMKERPPPLCYLHEISQPTGIPCWLLCGSSCSMYCISPVGLEKPEFPCKNPSHLNWFTQRAASSLFALGGIATAFTWIFSQTASTFVHPLRNPASLVPCLQGVLGSQEQMLATAAISCTGV